MKLTLDPRPNGGKDTPSFTTEIGEAHTYPVLGALSDLALQAQKDAERIVQRMQDGKIKELPTDLFEKFSDLEWLKNVPHIAAEGLLTPRFLSQKMRDFPPRSANDVKLLTLAVEYCQQEFNEKFGNYIAYTFGEAHRKAVDAQENMNLLMKDLDTIHTNVLGTNPGFSKPVGGLSLAPAENSNDGRIHRHML